MERSRVTAFSTCATNDKKVPVVGGMLRGIHMSSALLSNVISIYLGDFRGFNEVVHGIN